MRNTTVVMLAIMLVVASVRPVVAEDPKSGPIRASVEKLAAEAELQSDAVRTRSNSRVGLGVALAGAGAVMLLLDPKQPLQPTQPGLASEDALIDRSAALVGLLTVGDSIRLRLAAGAPVLQCEPLCIGDIDEAITGAFIVGAATGIASVITTIDAEGWRVYQGEFRPFIPYKERSPALKYGGAAMVIGGALIAGLWSDVPMMRNISVTPTVGGVSAARTLTW